ncbi:MAG: glycosyltransferase family 2 protein, partial [Nevskiales bacterium]|nr:glycosyltransferase family 2 protein [Nevskiales bacterium]
GRRADALNAGINVSHYPMLCVMDADCVFEEDALLRIIRPFLRDRRVVAAGGIVRPANGLRVREGRILGHGLPRSLLALFQTVEYLRSVQWARLGLVRLNSLLCISSAFMAVKKSVAIEMGGFHTDAICDDIEFTIALHEYIHRPRHVERLRIEYIPDPVCYTEVPEHIRLHATQRNRWQRGMLQSLLRHKHMTFNPRYGMAGLFGMPFFLFFDAFAALVEGLSYTLVPVLYFTGYVSLLELGLFFLIAIVLGAFLSIGAVLLQENTRLRASNVSELTRLLGIALLSNLGYHQMHLLWRIAGTFDYLVRRRTDLGSTIRHGSHQTAILPARRPETP